MKRAIMILTVAVMLFSACAARAEGGFGLGDLFPFLTSTPSPTATPAPDAFRFRDGIRWGMTTQQVKAMESVGMSLRSAQRWSALLTDVKVVVSRFTANLVYMFLDDRLMMISYEFPQADNEWEFRYLTGALSSLYGESAEADALTIKSLMDSINPNRYQIDQISHATGWRNSDGTAIYLYYYTADAFAILYVSPELGVGIYQTNGL